MELYQVNYYILTNLREINFDFFLFLAEGMPFIIEVFNSNNAMTSADGFSLIYTQIPCMGNRQ